MILSPWSHQILFLFLILTNSLCWAQFEWSGDLRYRLAESQEDIDQKRYFQQLRARFGFSAPVNTDTQSVVRLSTGTSAISGNQTLGDSKDPAMSRRYIGIDLAYIDWKINPANHLWAGRTANPFYSPGKVQTIYSSNLAFEGLAHKFENRWKESLFFFNFGSFIISENYSAPDDIVDSGILALQIGYSEKTDLGPWTLHLGYHHFLNIQDKGILSFDKDAKTDSYSYPFDKYKGNTVYPNDPLLPSDSRRYFFKNQYVLYELGAEWKTQISNHDFIFFFEWVKNTETSDLNTAQEYGLTWKWGRSSFTWASVDKKSDSVLGCFTDSDMNGGGSDNKGQRVSWSYKLSTNALVGLNNYQATRGLDSTSRKFNLTQLDIQTNF